jgi:predicted helicase
MTASDRGIDLVAEDLDGGLWGIQSKLYGPDQSLGWGDLSTWVGTTRGDKWVGWLLVS